MSAAAPAGLAGTSKDADAREGARPALIGAFRSRLLTALHRRVGMIRLPRPLSRAFVFRHEDVHQVLGTEPPAVSVAEYGRRMEETTGPFMLGEDDKDEHGRARGAVGKALHQAGLGARVLDVALAEATAVVERASRDAMNGRAHLDVVQDLARTIPVRVVETVFGVPDPHERLVSWNETFALYIFGPDLPPGRRRRRTRAREAGAAFREHVRNEVRRRRELPGGPNPDDTLLGHLLEALPSSGEEDDWATGVMVGTVAGGLVATIGLFSGAIDRLLELPPRHLEKLRRAAGSDDPSVRRSGVEAYLHEAARFAVSPGILYRDLGRDLVVAPGTERETRIPAGYRVWTVPALANLDPYVYPDPERFDPGRPREAYLFFGAGRHDCVGGPMAETLLYAMALPLVSRPDLRREDGFEKGMPYEGSWMPKTYPRHLPVSFEA